MAYRTGIMLEEGQGVKQDPEQASIYFKKAIQAGDSSAAWRVMTQIYNAKDVEKSELFGDCFQNLWPVWSATIWEYHTFDTKITPTQMKFPNGGIATCLNYIDLLQKSGKDEETYALKKKMIPIILKETSDSHRRDSLPEEIKDFLVKLAAIKTEAEEKQIAEAKQVAEAKLKVLDQDLKQKFPHSALGKGIKLYKNAYAGSSLEWLQAYAAISSKTLKEVTREMFEDEFLPEIPETWRGQPFRRNYTINDEETPVSYIYAGPNEQQTMIGCCIALRNVQPASIIEKYKKEFPGLKVQERNVPQMKLIVMLNDQVKIQIILMQPGNFVSVFIADRKYIDLYKDMIQKAAQEADKKALDF